MSRGSGILEVSSRREILEMSRGSSRGALFGAASSEKPSSLSRSPSNSAARFMHDGAAGGDLMDEVIGDQGLEKLVGDDSSKEHRSVKVGDCMDGLIGSWSRNGSLSARSAR